jgi:RNA polymerase sigma factor (sigma-70 family)
MKQTTIYRSENIQRYFNEIKNKKYNPLDDSIIRKMFRNREKYRDAIINAHIRLVATIAKHYDNSNEKFMDFNQVGIEGLLEAFEKYDPNQVSKFSSYASFWIKARCSNFCKELDIIQKSIQRKIGSKSQKFQEKIFREEMRDATPYEIAEHLEVEHNIEVNDYYDLYTLKVSSIDEPYDDDDMTSETSGEFATQTASENMFIKNMESEEMSFAIRKMFDMLTEKEKNYITRYIINEESYKDIAETEGYSSERVRQIIVGGLNKMKSSGIAKEYFSYYLKK